MKIIDNTGLAGYFARHFKQLKKLLKKSTFLKFSAVGVVNTAVGYGLDFILYNVFGVGFWISSVANYSAASIVSFFLNKYWTFNVRKWSLFMVVSYILTIAVSWFAAHKAALWAIDFVFAGNSMRFRGNAAKIAGFFLFAGLNYLGQRFVVFRKDSVPSIAPVENHRSREKGALVYPVYSRRSGGLSVGINLFPDKKHCNFDCPYCEVFPFEADAVFSLEQMEKDLRAAIADAAEKGITVKDICFSGNGEPSLSPHFPEALKLAVRIRDEITPSVGLVLITNGAGLLDQRLFALLKNAAAGTIALDIWLKLDAATPGWYEKINRSAIPHEKLIAKIREFTACAPVTIQTMLCAVDGNGPPTEEAQAWERLLFSLVENTAGGQIRKVQIYGKARPSPEDPKAQPLPVDCLEQRAASLRQAFNSLPAPSIEVYF